MYTLLSPSEPDWFFEKSGMVKLSGSRVGEDYAILKAVLDKYPAFKNSVLVGPDTGSKTYDTHHGHFQLFKE